MKKVSYLSAALFVLVSQGSSLVALKPECSVTTSDNTTYDAYNVHEVKDKYYKEHKIADISGRLAAGACLAAPYAPFFVGMEENSFKAVGKALLRFYPRYAVLPVGLAAVSTYYGKKAHKISYEYELPLRQDVSEALKKEVGSEKALWCLVKKREVESMPYHHGSILL